MVKTCPKGYSKVYVSRVGHGPKVKGVNFDSITCEKNNSAFKSLVGKTQAAAVRSLRTKKFKCSNHGTHTICHRGTTQLNLYHKVVRGWPTTTERATVTKIKHLRSFSYTGQ